ncbi:uncharacterized protein METZ01_LOCUS109438, partial [marine metagenome]
MLEQGREIKFVRLNNLLELVFFTCHTSRADCPSEMGRLPVQRYLVRRLLAVIPTLFFASIIVFLVIRLLPGDAVDLIIKSSPFIENTEEMREQIEADLGLDKPMHLQYVHWISDIIFRGDLGTSLMRETSVGAEISERVPVTITMGLL